MDRLDAFSVLRFPGVCKSWAAAYEADPRRLRSGAVTLLTSALDGGGDKATGTFALHDVSTGRSFPAAAEGLKNRWWVGGKDGWLVTTDAMWNVELLNPVSGDTVRLPSFTTITGATLVEDKHFKLCVDVGDGSRPIFYRLKQVALCRTPAHQNGYLAVAIFTSNQLAFTAAGDECWTALGKHAEEFISCAGAVAHDGKIFAVNLGGDVYSWDLSWSLGIQYPEMVRAPKMPVAAGQNRRFSLATTPGAGGRLLLVCTHGDCSSICGRPFWGRRTVYTELPILGGVRGVTVHELDVGSGMLLGGAKWRRMPDLGGDHALFVGVNYPFHVADPPRGSNDNGVLKANCVYAADVSGYDAVVFEMKKKKGCTGGFEPLVYAGAVDDEPLQKPIWFRPGQALGVGSTDPVT